jgi:hypothetical protein
MKRTMKKLVCDDCGLSLTVRAANFENALRRIGWKLFPAEGEDVVRCVGCRLDLIEATETVLREIDRI